MSGGRILAGIGRYSRKLAQRYFYLAGLSMECVVGALKPSSWVYPVRARLFRQILFSGVEAIPFTMFAAALVGAVLTINSFQWLEWTGRIDFLGPALSILVIREAAPFFSIVIIICASASAITTEMASMRVSGEIDLIESQGINLVQLLILPRSIGLAISAAGLSVVFVAVAFLASAVGILVLDRFEPGPFFDSIFRAINTLDFVNLFGRSTIPAFFIGGICCYEGLTAPAAATAVPQAVTKAMLRSVAATLVVSAVIAVISYL